MAIVTWAPKSDLEWRTMHVRRCDLCAKEYHQVPEDCLCPSCNQKGQLVGITWPVGKLYPLGLVADRHGEPCLDFEVVRQSTPKEETKDG